MQYLYLVLLISILLENTYQLIHSNVRVGARTSRQKLLIDTSVLIDGRIILIANSNFISDIVTIPQSVIGELQKLADGQDSEKRVRARYGLDVISELKEMNNINVEILHDGSNASEGVDERLINLAKKYKAKICTVDYNLNKVAKVEGISVLNINDLAMSIRTNFIPGDKVEVKLLDKGSERGQAVGYLTDGTMIVVDDAQKMIGQKLTVEIKRSLQTSAGRMVFANTMQQNRPSRKTLPYHRKSINR
jgi:uncharacterized protein YacL